MAKKLLVIGSGMAGGKLVEEVLAADRQRWDITIVGDEPEGNYNRIKLNYCLGGEEPEEFHLNPPAWYLREGVNAILGHKAASIDRTARSVTLDNGRVLAYDHLVLATGSRPFVPTIRNGHLPVVLAIRSLTDARAARPLLDRGKRAIVVGGGLLGLELALVLRSMGLAVTVSQFMPTLMETQLDEAGGRTLQALLEAEGLAFVMDNSLVGIDPLDPANPSGAFSAEFKDGTRLVADVVLVSTGIRPHTELAKAAGLECHRGIKVDARLNTSDPTISAVGECIEFEGRIWGLVAPAYEQARTLATVLCGGEAAYKPGPAGLTRLKSDIAVISMGQFNPAPAATGANPTALPGGPADPELRSIVYQDPGRVYKKLVVKGDKLVGALLVGDEQNADTIALHFTAGLPLGERPGDLLFAVAGGAGSLPDPSLWPDDLTVCDCNGVSAGKLRHAIAGGADTLTKLMNATKAGTGCGNCKGKLRALLASQPGGLKDDPSERWFVPGIPLERPALEEFITSRALMAVSAVLAAWPGSQDDVKTRNGLDFLLNYLWRGDYEKEDDSRTANDRYSGNIQKDGRFSVIPDIPGGLATPAQLRAIASVAEEYKAAIKVTGADRIGLYALNKEDLPEVWDKLQMGCGHAFTKTFRACKACVGSRYCRYGLADSLGLGERMASRYRGVMGPAKFKMGVSGCPRNCAEATIKDLGVVAGDGGWDISIGGNGGATVAVARHLVRVRTDDEVIRIADRFYEYYRRHARFGERSAPFIERVGFETVRDAVLADWPVPQADGSVKTLPVPAGAENLEASFAATLAAYRDPWREGRRPAVDFGADGYIVPAAAKAAEPVPADFSFSSLVGRIPGPPPAERQLGSPAGSTRAVRTATAAGPDAASGPAGAPLDAPKTLPGGFKAVIAVDQLPAGGSRVVNVQGRRVAVFHGRDGSWLVCEEFCPHERGPLADGTYARGQLTCTIHQYSWDAKTGANAQGNCGKLTVYRHQLANGLLYAQV